MNYSSFKLFLSVIGSLFILLIGCSKKIDTKSNTNTLPPDPPSSVKTSLSIKADGSMTSISWKDNSLNEAGFDIQARARYDNNYQSVGKVEANVTQFVDSVSKPHETTYYRIIGFNDKGESQSTREGLRLGYYGTLEIKNISDYELYGAVLFLLWHEGLSSIDVSDAKKPKIVNTIPLKNYVRSGQIKINDSLLYVTDDDKLFILGVANPLDPSFISFLDLGFSPLDMEILDSTIYILGDDLKIHVIDASNPKQARKIRTVLCEGNPQNIAVTSKKLFVANERKGIKVFDLSSPLTPVYSFDFTGKNSRHYSSVTAYGKYIFASVRDFENEVHIINFEKGIPTKIEDKISLGWVPLKIALGKNIMMIPEVEGGAEIFSGRSMLNLSLSGNVDTYIDKVKTWPTLTAMSYQSRLYLFATP